MNDSPTSICVCLLSDQRMMNIIPLFQRGLCFDKVILLSSQTSTGEINPHFAQIAQQLQSALGDEPQCELYPIPVDPMNPESVKKVCLDLIKEYPSETRITINFTGGLKPMSIGAYLAGMQTNAKLLYVDTQTETIYYFENDRYYSEPFHLNKITVRKILEAHGRLVDEKSTSSLQKPAHDRLAEVMLTDPNTSIQQILFIQKKIRAESFKPSGEKAVRSHVENRLPQIFSKMYEIGEARKSGNFIFLNKSASGFFNGGWLESFVFQALQKSGVFMDVCSRVKIATLENELDGACCYNGKLGVVECKSGSIKGTEGQAILARLKVLKDTLGGTFAKTFLVTTSDPKDISEGFNLRAREYASQIIHLNDLPHVHEIIQATLSSTKRSA